jgi:hypothetical protein
MLLYWTLQITGEPREVGFGPPSKFIRWLYAKKLPHTGREDWISDMLGNESADGNTSYVFVSEGKTVWTLTWGNPQPGVHDMAI